MFENFKYFSDRDWQLKFQDYQSGIFSNTAFENKEELNNAHLFILNQLASLCHELSQINERLMYMENQIRQLWEREHVQNQKKSELMTAMASNSILKNEMENLLMILKLVENEQNTK